MPAAFLSTRHLIFLTQAGRAPLVTGKTGSIDDNEILPQPPAEGDSSPVKS